MTAWSSTVCIHNGTHKYLTIETSLCTWLRFQAMRRVAGLCCGPTGSSGAVGCGASSRHWTWMDSIPISSLGSLHSFKLFLSSIWSPVVPSVLFFIKSLLALFSHPVRSLTALPHVNEFLLLSHLLQSVLMFPLLSFMSLLPFYNFLSGPWVTSVLDCEVGVSLRSMTTEDTSFKVSDWIRTNLHIRRSNGFDREQQHALLSVSIRSFVILA